MEDRTWRAISLVLAVICAALLGVTGALLMEGSGSQASAAPVGPSAFASAIAPATAAPSPAATPMATASPAKTASAKPTPSPTPSPSAPTASITFTGLMLDAEADPSGTARTFTFMSDGWGTVVAQVTATSPQGQTKMCISVDGSKAVCVTGGKPAMLNGRADTAHSLWTVSLSGLDASTPTVDVLFRWPTALPEIRLTHGRFQGEGVAESQNGFGARFTTHVAGTIGVQASWTTIQADATVRVSDVTGTAVRDERRYGGASTLDPPYAARLEANRTYLVELRNASADNLRPDLSATVTFPQ